MDYGMMLSSDNSNGADVKRRRAAFCFFISWAAIPYIGIAILFGLYATEIRNKSYGTTHVYTGSVGISFPTTIKSTLLQSTSVPKGTVVSLSTSGKLQQGGGTTIYNDIIKIDAKCPKYLDIDAVYDSTFLMFYSNSKTKQTTLNVAQASSSKNSGTIKATTTTSAFIYQLSTLSQSSGLFVGLTQKDFTSEGLPAILAGKVSQDASSITLGTQKQYSDGYSLNPLMSRLTTNSFAVSYFTPYVYNEPIYVSTFYGTVDASTLAVTLSPAIHYIDDSNFTAHHDIVGIRSNVYLVINFFSNKPITATVMKIPSATSGSLVAPSIGLKATLKGSAPVYVTASTRLDDNTAVITFVDSTSNNNIVCALVSVDNSINPKVTFGSLIQATSGTALQTFKIYNYMDLDIQSLSEDSFALLFSDVANGGRMTTAVMEITASGDIARKTPDFVLSTPNPDIDNYYSWGAMTSTSTGELALLYSRTNYNCSQSATTSLSLMELKGRPLGISTQASASSEDISITASGAVSGLSGLTVGSSYYTNSNGDLIDSGLPFGQTPLPGSIYDYVSSIDGKMLLSADSYIGYAVSSDTILLK
eukprot:gene5001-10007_t